MAQHLGRRWARVKDPIRRASHGQPCPACGKPLNTFIRYRDPRTGVVNPSYVSVDKIVPLDKGGDPFDPNNLRAMHFGCNSSRGNTDNGRQPLTSTPW